MTQIMIPELESCWLMKAPWSMPETVLQGYRNEGFLKAVGFSAGVDDWRKATGDNTGVSGWAGRYHEWRKNSIAKIDLLVPEGTIFRVNRIHLGQSDDKTSVEFLSSPRLSLLPRKRGGNARGKLRLFLPVEVLNTFPEVESFDENHL